MQRLIRGNGGPAGLRKNQLPRLRGKGKGAIDATGGAAGDGPGVRAVKLNANADEFVPRHQKYVDDLLKQQYPEVSALAFVPGSKKEAMTQVNVDSDEDLAAWDAANEKSLPPWKGFPRRSIKVGPSSQVVPLNDKEYMVVPRQKGGKKPGEDAAEKGASAIDPPMVLAPNDSPPRFVSQKHFAAEEKRREQGRKVAVEALKMVEQRRARRPSKPRQQIFHISRSPIRYTPKERIRVDAMRLAKKKRIERILLEMSEEKEQQKGSSTSTGSPSSTSTPTSPNTSTSPSTSTSTTPSTSPKTTAKRYIPTAKEWDELRRTKREGKREGKREAKKAPVQTHGQQIPVVTGERKVKRPDQPFYVPPGQCKPGERRKGNLTRWRGLPVWTLQIQQQPLPLTDQYGKVIHRYTIKELLDLEPQPEDMERPSINAHALHLGFLYN